MAKRVFFISSPETRPIFIEQAVEFKYFNGFAISQKQKSIASMHESIERIDNRLKVLEISTKSPDTLGVALSAFNLKFLDEKSGNEYPLENIFQSSKVFEFGGPYRDLLKVHPKDAKRNERLKNSGKLIRFDYNDTIWDKDPKTMFYDWIYVNSLQKNERLAKEILKYNAFTDIEFNQEKSINCQARSAAIFVSLCRLGKLQEAINDKEKFKKIYMKNNQIERQMSLFDI